MTSEDYVEENGEGASLSELFDTFPDEKAAQDWFEAARWRNGRVCAKCESAETRETKNAKPMPYWCKACRSYFSVKTGTVMQASNIPLRKWAIAICQMTSSLKGVSSMKLHRDLGISQKSAWHMARRIREAAAAGDPLLAGLAESDEIYL